MVAVSCGHIRVVGFGIGFHFGFSVKFMFGTQIKKCNKVSMSFFKNVTEYSQSFMDIPEWLLS